MSQRLQLLSNHLTSSDPLSPYRKQGRFFNSAELRGVFLGEFWQYHDDVMNVIENSPKFDLLQDAERTRENSREVTIDRIFEIFKTIKLQDDVLSETTLNRLHTYTQTGIQYSVETIVRISVSVGLYGDCISSLGTEKHVKWVQRVRELKDVGCFAMTELGHGSNVSQIETTATFDPSTREFILHSPTPTATKVWIGGLGNSANMSSVFAQLYVKGVNQGVHAFVIPIRHDQTHDPLPGLVIGDMGAKIGLHGIDNGFIRFDNYRVPYDALLDRLGQIDENGDYVSSIENPQQRFGSSMASLSSARLFVSLISNQQYMQAIFTAIRWGAIRKQFSPDGGQEVALIEYPMHQYRLIPHIAKIVAVQVSIRTLYSYFYANKDALTTKAESKRSKEFHAITTSLKALASQYSIDGVAKARAACGGMGYSALNLFDKFVAEADINATWEGEADVMFQQCGRYLMLQYQQIAQGKTPKIDFLSSVTPEILQVQGKKCKISDTSDITPEILIEILQDSMHLLLLNAVERVEDSLKTAKSQQEAFNSSQVFGLKEATIAFTELYLARNLFIKSNELVDQNNKHIFTQLAQLFCYDSIERNAKNILGYITEDQLWLIRSEIVRLCQSISVDAINFIDALRISDKFYGAVIARKDGRAYERFTEEIEKEVGGKPKWLGRFLEARRRVGGQ